MSTNEPASSASGAKGADAAPRIYVMPEQFLAITRAAKLPIAPPPPPAVAVPPSAAGAPSAAAPPTKLPAPSAASGMRRPLVIGGIAIVAVLVIGGLGAFFTLRSIPVQPSTPGSRPQDAPAIPPSSSPAASAPEPAAIPTPTPEPPAPAADQDTDTDGLTDAEEVLLGMDIGLRDTDSDGYDDRTELMNLYNPTGVAPQRLIDAGLVYAYEHPIDHWEIYVPTKWSVRATDQEQREVVIATGVIGEDVVVSVLENPERLPFPVFATREFNIPDAEHPMVLHTKRGASGFRYARDPKFASIILAPDRVLTLSHRLTSVPPRYPHLFTMMVESFRVPPG